jgi:hypothetical protein
MSSVLNNGDAITLHTDNVDKPLSLMIHFPTSEQQERGSLGSDEEGRGLVIDLYHRTPARREKEHGFRTENSFPQRFPVDTHA